MSTARGLLFLDADLPAFRLSLPSSQVNALSSSQLWQISNIMLLDVEELVTFIRTPTWITAGFAQRKAGPGGANFEFTQGQKDEFCNDPEAYVKYRKDIENELNRRFKLARLSPLHCVDNRN
jgi:hypothetical protein